jgi:ubiquinone/menaquinone biosynthesis C-methylase UbiE
MNEVAGAATFQTAAENYDRHIGRYGPRLASQLIAAAGVGPEMSVLDVGCGPGALTRALVGAGARVTAVDPSQPFATACQQRAPRADVHVGSAEPLPFEDGTFDAALAQLVVNFMTDAPAGVREMARVTRPGGVVACAVWDYAGEMTILRRFWESAIALDPAAATRSESQRMQYCTPESLGELWSAAGLSDVTVTSCVVAADYEGFADLWAPLEAGVAPSGAYVVSLDPAARSAFAAEFRRRLGVGDEPFSLSARAWIAVGRVR